MNKYDEALMKFASTKEGAKALSESQSAMGSAGRENEQTTKMHKECKEGIYVEPSNYFSKEIRKEFGLGEYAGKEQAGDTKE